MGILKGAISVNSDFTDFLMGKDTSTYESTVSLLIEFINKGHNIAIVFPENLINGSFKKAYLFTPPNKLTELDPREANSGDVFIVRCLGENLGPRESESFIRSLGSLDSRFGHVVNTAQSTLYEIKSLQKELDLPFIPGYKPKGVVDITDILREGPLIAKPACGYMGQGIAYLQSGQGMNGFNGNSIGDYCFERYIPAKSETRVVFLNGKIILSRVRFLEGNPGKERCTGYKLVETTENQARIVHSAIEQTGMFFGSVDFRQGYVLEVNGSGLGLSVPRDPSVPNSGQLYNLEKMLIEELEKKQSNN